MLQVYDTYETAQTVLDPCASLAEKGTILGLYVFGLALPGGGYSTAGKTGIRSVKRLDQADDLRQTFKLVDRADDTRAATRIGDEVDEIDTIKVVDDLCFHSFSAETLVSTEDGLRPISEIVIGEWVWAYHEGTGEYGLFPVTDVIVHTDPTQVHLLLDGELLETTPEHPFYTLERGWVDAGDLWVGAHIRKAGGSYGRVQFLAVEREDQVMYNLTVDEAHTFFVGAQRWLVHNSGCLMTPGGRRIDPGHEEKIFNERQFADWELDNIIDNRDIVYKQNDGAKIHLLKNGDIYDVVITSTTDDDFIVTAYRMTDTERRGKVKKGIWRKP